MPGHFLKHTSRKRHANKFKTLADLKTHIIDKHENTYYATYTNQSKGLIKKNLQNKLQFIRTFFRIKIKNYGA